jgi:dTDP-4-dehydrorhamnose 3,5-epimerase-like enzyme
MNNRVNLQILGGAKLVSLPSFKDSRGDLSPIDFNEQLPFIPSRFFVVSDTPPNSIRGNHAHYSCEQFLVVIQGKINVIIDDGIKNQVIELISKDSGLFIPKLLWASQVEHSSDAILGVFASHRYDKNDYINDYEDYIKIREKLKIEAINNS